LNSIHLKYFEKLQNYFKIERSCGEILPENLWFIVPNTCLEVLTCCFQYWIYFASLCEARCWDYKRNMDTCITQGGAEWSAIFTPFSVIMSNMQGWSR